MPVTRKRKISESHEVSQNIIETKSQNSKVIVPDIVYEVVNENDTIPDQEEIVTTSVRNFQSITITFQNLSFLLTSSFVKNCH